MRPVAGLREGALVGEGEEIMPLRDAPSDPSMAGEILEGDPPE